MSSIFRAPRSGEKLLRRRSRTLPASPYGRPPEMSPPAAQSGGSPRWFAGLISGAGKLISSVLPSKRSVSPSSSSEEEEEETSSEFDEDGEHCGLSQGRKESESAIKQIAGPLAVVPQSESKRVIEDLLMQETFSRDECNRLTMIIQSRVIDFPSPKVCGEGTLELQSMTTGNDIPLPVASPSFGQKRSFTERVSYFSSKPNLYSPESSAFEACTLDIYNKAIEEAKKWLEEKKLASKPKYDPECGPCTLNTDMLNHEIEDVGGSPVDMAKSYMKSLPPWRSPSFSRVEFFNPPPSRILRDNEEIFHETANNSPSSSKGRKRDHVVFGSLDTLDETRRVRLRSADKAEISKSKQIETSAGGSEFESSKCLLDADKKELYAGNHCCNVAFRLPDKKEDDANHPLKTVDTKSSNDVSEPEEVICVATLENSVSKAHPPEPTECLDENKIMEEAVEVSVPNDTLASASRLVEPNGNPSSETEVPLTENIELVAPSDAGDDAGFSDVQTSDKQISTGVEGTVLADDSSQLNPVSRVAATNCIFDSRPHDGNSHIAKNANGSINQLSTDSSTAEVNAESDHETLNRETDKIVPQNGNGTRMKTNERMLSEPRRTSSRRGRKVVVKSRRGRKS